MAIQKVTRARKNFLVQNQAMSIDLDHEIIGRRLEAVRLVCTSLNQENFADLMGAGKQQYNNWTKGSPFPVYYAAELVVMFKVTLDWIYLGDPSGLPFDRKRELDRKVSELGKSKPPRRVSNG